MSSGKKNGRRGGGGNSDAATTPVGEEPDKHKVKKPTTAATNSKNPHTSHDEGLGEGGGVGEGGVESTKTTNPKPTEPFFAHRTDGGFYNYEMAKGVPVAGGAGGKKPGAEVKQPVVPGAEGAEVKQPVVPGAEGAEEQPVVTGVPGVVEEEQPGAEVVPGAVEEEQPGAEVVPGAVEEEQPGEQPGVPVAEVGEQPGEQPGVPVVEVGEQPGAGEEEQPGVPVAEVKQTGVPGTEGGKQPEKKEEDNFLSKLKGADIQKKPTKKQTVPGEQPEEEDYVDAPSLEQQEEPEGGNEYPVEGKYDDVVVPANPSSSERPATVPTASTIKSNSNSTGLPSPSDKNNTYQPPKLPSFLHNNNPFDNPTYGDEPPKNNSTNNPDLLKKPSQLPSDANNADQRPRPENNTGNPTSTNNPFLSKKTSPQLDNDDDSDDSPQNESDDDDFKKRSTQRDTNREPKPDTNQKSKPKCDNESEDHSRNHRCCGKYEQCYRPDYMDGKIQDIFQDPNNFRLTLKTFNMTPEQLFKPRRYTMFGFPKREPIPQRQCQHYYNL